MNILLCTCTLKCMTVDSSIDANWQQLGQLAKNWTDRWRQAATWRTTSLWHTWLLGRVAPLQRRFFPIHLKKLIRNRKRLQCFIHLLRSTPLKLFLSMLVPASRCSKHPALASLEWATSYKCLPQSALWSACLQHNQLFEVSSYLKNTDDFEQHLSRKRLGQLHILDFCIFMPEDKLEYVICPLNVKHLLRDLLSYIFWLRRLWALYLCLYWILYVPRHSCRCQYIAFIISWVWGGHFQIVGLKGR